MKEGAKEKFKIIFAAQDLGGFKAILPVIKKLKNKKNLLLKIILADESIKSARENRISYQDGSKLTDKKLTRLLKEERPDLVFTATSLGRSVEKRITKVAKDKKIKTIAIVDFWANYKKRFSSLPDYILVIDEIMKKEMIKEGFNSQKLIITGNPFFDSFSKLAFSQEEKIISFFCQPISELYKHPEFDEIKVFNDLVETFEKLEVKMPIKIKFHPRTKKINKFNKIIKNSKLKILIEKRLSAEKLIERSKLITGMNSIMLFLAAMTKKKVLSYQPNLKGPDPLISNRLGLSTPVYKKENLCSVLRKLLFAEVKNKNLRIIEKYTRNKSTKKVIKFIINFQKHEK